MGPFDRFNDRAKRVLALAQDEAIRFNHNYIGAEHLLLGLVREGEGVAARVLDSLGVELSKVRAAVEFTIGRGDATTSPSEITLTPRVKKIIELALDEARELGVKLEPAREAVAKTEAPGLEWQTPGVGLTPRGMRLVEAADRLAGGGAIRPECLLLAYAADQDAPGSKILAALGATPAAIRDLINKLNPPG